MNLKFRLFLLLSLLPAAIALGWFEWRANQQLDERKHIGEGRPKSPKFARVLTELDPNSREGNYLLGLEAFQYFARPEVDEEHYAEKARDLFGRALAASPQDKENEEQLVYLYAVMLVVLDADTVEIDAAIARWRRNFPKSRMTEDPRQYAGTHRLAERVRLRNAVLSDAAAERFEDTPPPQLDFSRSKYP